jgi:hypothetical protein
MGTLVLHAGRGKTGSSSIQRWLGDNAGWLRRQHGVHVLTVRRTDDPTGFDVVKGEHGRSKSFLGHWPLDRVRAEKLFAALDGPLKTFEAVVLSSEGFGRWFYDLNEDVLAQLDRFGLVHEVRVAYYVRPQHTSLESAWTQWGFREGISPSEFIGERVPSLHHLGTVEGVDDTAPHVSFVVRPFRTDLLEAGDVVADFAKVFLGIRDVPALSDVKRENVAFPLELVNVLRYAPDDMFWTSPHDNGTLRLLRNLGVAEWSVPESAKIQRSRLVLQAFCQREYEAENQELVRRFGWCADHFVPPAQSGREGQRAELTELDRLWEPDASEQEQALLFQALLALVRRGTPA